MNWKVVAIIIATAIATAVAVVLMLQKQNNKRKMRFDSSEFDEDDFMDDIACGEQCNFTDENLDIDVEDKSAGAAEEAPAAEEEAADKDEKAEDIA